MVSRKLLCRTPRLYIIAGMLNILSTFLQRYINSSADLLGHFIWKTRSSYPFIYSVVLYRTPKLMYHPVAIDRNLYAVVSYSVTWYRNLNDVVTYPVNLYRNLNVVVSYPVTIDGIQEIAMSYNATVCYSRDAVMSYPIVSCLTFFQVAQNENVVSGFQNWADR